MPDLSIEDVRTGLYRIPNEEALEDATQSFDVLELILTEVTLSDGTEGLGFTYTIGEGGSAMREFLDTTLVPVLLDDCPAAPRPARERLRRATTFVGREGISEPAIGAVDVALWDALGRRRNAPLYDLLGATRRTVPAYQTHGGWLQFSVDELVEHAHDAADQGFAGVKMKVGRGHAEDARRVTAVRDALPEHMDLMVDANCAYTVPEARRLAAALDDVPLAWLEEPLNKGDYAAHADLRDRVNVPIALGENLFNPTQFKQALASRAVDVLQPDVGRVGGITPWLTVAELGLAWDLPVSPHYLEPIHVHLCVAFENVPYMEHHSTVLDSVSIDPLELVDGGFRPPTDPGHGIRFEGLDQYAVT
ncbi:MAG: mandelate racemase/muconate lactonizing enzyme family protein, partial [Halobacteriales archaeon]|nr:mandelate racemase/muconate lactonizing enzyme family protein [Halobacteriales archaeon]